MDIGIFNCLKLTRSNDTNEAERSVVDLEVGDLAQKV